MSSDYDKQQWQAEQAARDIAVEKQRDKERKTRERSARNAQRKLERLHRTLSEKGEITDFENEFGESVLERLDKFGSAFHSLEKGRPGDALSFAQKSVVAAMNKKVKSLKKAEQKNRISGDNAADDPNSQNDSEDDFDDGYERTADRWKNQNAADKNSGKNKRSSFGSKNKPKFTPRVRHIEDDFEGAAEDSAHDKTAPAPAPPRLYETLAPELKNRVPYLPQYRPDNINVNKSKPQASDAETKTNITPITIKADLAKANLTKAEAAKVDGVKAGLSKDSGETPAPKKPFLRLIQ